MLHIPASIRLSCFSLPVLSKLKLTTKMGEILCPSFLFLFFWFSDISTAYSTNSLSSSIHRHFISISYSQLPPFAPRPSQTPHINPITSENETLLLAVLSQLTITKLNYVLLAQQVGSPTPGAAAKRWQQFQKKLKDTSPPPSFESVVGIAASPKGLGKKGRESVSPGKKQVGIVKIKKDKGRGHGVSEI